MGGVKNFIFEQFIDFDSDGTRVYCPGVRAGTFRSDDLWYVYLGVGDCIFRNDHNSLEAGDWRKYDQGANRAVSGTARTAGGHPLCHHRLSTEPAACLGGLRSAGLDRHEGSSASADRVGETLGGLGSR